METAEMTNTTAEAETAGKAQKGDGGKGEESKENSDAKPDKVSCKI